MHYSICKLEFCFKWVLFKRISDVLLEDISTTVWLEWMVYSTKDPKIVRGETYTYDITINISNNSSSNGNSHIFQEVWN